MISSIKSVIESQNYVTKHDVSYTVNSVSNVSQLKVIKLVVLLMKKEILFIWLSKFVILETLDNVEKANISSARSLSQRGVLNF